MRMRVVHNLRLNEKTKAKNNNLNYKKTYKPYNLFFLIDHGAFLVTIDSFRRSHALLHCHSLYCLPTFLLPPPPIYLWFTHSPPSFYLLSSAFLNIYSSFHPASSSLLSLPSLFFLRKLLGTNIFSYHR